MAEFSTLEIATICEVTERTVQRWLGEGKLKNTHIRGNRYEVSETDLAPFLPHKVAEHYMERLESLETRVEELERLLAARMSSNKPPRSQPAPSSAPTMSSTLPDGYVPIADLIKQHNASETTVMRNMRPYLKKGPWKTSDGRAVKYALDLEGQAKFREWYAQSD